MTCCITISNINSTWPVALRTEGGKKGGKEGEFFIRHKRLASRCMLDWKLSGASCLNVKALCRNPNVISHDLTSLITPPLWRGTFLSGKIQAGCFRPCIFLNIIFCFSPCTLRIHFRYLSVFKTGDVSRRIWIREWKHYRTINKAVFLTGHYPIKTQLWIFWDYEWIIPCLCKLALYFWMIQDIQPGEKSRAGCDFTLWDLIGFWKVVSLTVSGRKGRSGFESWRWQSKRKGSKLFW